MSGYDVIAHCVCVLSEYLVLSVETLRRKDNMSTYMCLRCSRDFHKVEIPNVGALVTLGSNCKNNT